MSIPVPQHEAIVGSNDDKVKVQRVLISVSDKTGCLDLAKSLSNDFGVHVLSTGGTAALLRSNGVQVTDVSEYTKSPEMLDGRVKTLHPMIHGGILGVRGNDKHSEDMKTHGILQIDAVILNLYPFEQTVASGASFEKCVENVDIGGPAMLRAAAKNHASVAVVTSPKQYDSFLSDLRDSNGCTSMSLRKRFAANAFALAAHYDGAIASYMSEEVATEIPSVTRTYEVERPLKYGCNPNQKPAALCHIGVNGKLPFEILNGNPGYINLLDASNAWMLVKELRNALDLPAAASFKHVSPAGAAVAVPLNSTELEAYEIPSRGDINLTPAALAYLRARQADPMSSFGDFAALSDIVDAATAQVLKTEVSDGIIAPGYEDAALEILRKKKNGAYIILKADPTYEPPSTEYREVYGSVFMQRRNDCAISKDMLTNIPTKNKAIDEAAARDLLVATITLKYTQSNSICFAKNGQVVGVGAGQQSRVDCVKLAGRKVHVWWLRQHPKVLNLPFKSGIKRQDRINARVRYIEGDIIGPELLQWEQKFSTVPEKITAQEKDDFMTTLTGVSLASDAFFPFRDSIDHASKLGVTYVSQAGGSVQDDNVVAACDEYGIACAMTGQRLFHH